MRLSYVLHCSRRRQSKNSTKPFGCDRMRYMATRWKYLFNVLAIALCLCGGTTLVHGQAFPRPRKDTGPKPKNIRGLVTDARGKPLPGAQIFVRDVKTKV